MAIKINANTVRKILAKETIYIGLDECSLEKNYSYLIQMLETRSHTKDCKGPDRTKASYNCGQEGHDTKECQYHQSCPLCQEKGHRAGAGVCTDYNWQIIKNKGIKDNSGEP